MPKITPNYLEMKASDLPATKAFYEQAFGFAFTDYGPDYAAVEGGPVDIGLAAGGLNVLIRRATGWRSISRASIPPQSRLSASGKRRASIRPVTMCKSGIKALSQNPNRD